MDIPRRTFVVCDFSCFYAVNTRMSGLIYVPSTDIDDGGKTRIGGQKRVPARCQLEFVRKVDVSYRQSFFEHHSFFIDWAGIICTIQKKLKDSNIDNMDFDHKNWYLSKRIRPIKENEWWSCIAIGSNDHITTSDKVKRDDWPDSRRTILGNYYVAVTKYTKKNIS